MKFPLTILLLFCSIINGRKFNDIAELIPFTGNIAVYMQRLFEVRNVSIPQENIEDINLKRIMYGVGFYSILDDILMDTSLIIPNVSKECRTAGEKLLIPFKHKLDPMILFNSSLGKMLDAWGKIPDRILIGNTQWIGAYEECSQVPGAKYCSSTMKLAGYASVYGSCFPKECGTDDVDEVMRVVSNYTKGLIHITDGETYCDKPITYSTGAIITIVILTVILLLCIIGTSVELLQGLSITEDINPLKETERTRQASIGIENKGLDCNILSSSNLQPVDNVTSDMDVSLRSPSITKTVQNKTSLVHLITCFSLLKNTKAILSTHVPKGSITSINGIRVISLTWVIFGHYYAFVILGSKPDNTLNVLKILHRFSFLVLDNAYVSVDSFFLLSGLLLSYLTLRRIDKKGMGISDVLMLYLHRYIRLTPSLALVILFYTNILPLLSKGPTSLAVVQTDVMTKPCYDYWWSVLLYINNFYPESNSCVGWSWYLANDMQFFIVSPGILLLMVYVEKKCNGHTKALLYNLLVITLMCLLSMLITGIITGVYDLPSLMTASLFPKNPRAKQAGASMQKVYLKPYCRITPYLIGIFLGYLFSRNVTFNGKRSKVIYAIGWVLAIVFGLLVVYGPWSVFKTNGTFFNDSENIMYAACHRFVWGCAVAWVIYACHNKAGGLVNTFLSWRAWIPLSRLTYGGYLLHLMVMMYWMYIQEVRVHYQDSIAVFDFTSITIISYAVAFLLAVCVEYPILNLEKKLFKR